MLGDINNIRDIINSGNSFCLVGSGASCEMGIPSWEKLTEKIIQKIKELVEDNTQEWLQQKFERKEYLNIFQKAYDVLGEKVVIDFLKEIMKPTSRIGRIYQIISNWPFKNYFTTNFDGFLKKHLDQTGIYFSVKDNSESDINSITDSTKNTVVELHGSLNDTKTLVLTQKQYNEILHAPNKEYFRRKLREFFDLYNMIIIGYSLGDPDISFFMNEAKFFASPEKAFYMFLADVPDEDIRILYEEKNVRIIPYSTYFGRHQQLVDILEMIDNFIIPRKRERVSIEKEDIETASALYLHTKMQIGDAKREFGCNVYGVLILNSLWKLSNYQSNSIENIIKNFPFKNITLNNYDNKLFEDAIAKLKNYGLISETFENDMRVFALKSKGIRELENSRSDFNASEEQFQGQINLNYKAKFPDSNPVEQNQFTNLLKTSIIQFFKQRGLALASAIWGRRELDFTEDKDIFKIFKKYASQLKGPDKQIYLLKEIANLLRNPNKIQKEYLSILSQRYFTYHALNLDPKCQTFRLDYLKRTLWIIDSSIILPLIAKNCENHQYAFDFFRRIQELGIPIFATSGLFQEVVSHANWVKSFMSRSPSDIEFLSAAYQKGEYRENLFIKGYLNTAVETGLKGFKSYFKALFPTDNYEELVKREIEKYGVRVIEFDKWLGFDITDWGEIPNAEKKIEDKRKNIGTFKSPTQCQTEAIVVNILRNERLGKYDILSIRSPKDAYFISQSGVVNTLKKDGEKIFTWSPESFYRYLSTFPGLDKKTDYFYECMITSFNSGGLLVMNEEKYRHYFGDLIQQSNLEMKKIAEQYKDTLGEKEVTEKSRWYEKTPDLEKPLFIHHLSLKLAEIEKEKRIETERRLSEIKQTKELKEWERQDYEKLKSEKAQRKARHLKKMRGIQSRRKKKRKIKKKMK